MNQCKGACVYAVGDSVSEKSGTCGKCVCVRAFTTIAVPAKKQIPHATWQQCVQEHGSHDEGTTLRSPKMNKKRQCQGAVLREAARFTSSSSTKG